MCNKTLAGAFTDGRLSIGITKFDTNYDCSKKRKEELVTAEMVKERVIESIQDATDAMVSNDTIIPLCGECALAGSKLASSMISDPQHTNIMEAKYREAAEVLQRFPHQSLLGGQGQSYIDAIMERFSPEDLVQEIESVSGVFQLKTR